MSVESEPEPAGQEPPGSGGAGCPAPTAHKRLEEGHRWWHGCLDNYDDPPSFQANLNACLQALRNVTFALQKEKRLIPDFDVWYPPQQDAMRANPLMRWLVNSRNRVVKSGDLELLSTATMRLILQYQDVASAVSDSLPDATKESRTKTLPLYARPSEYHKFLAEIPASILKQSSIFIERRWVDKALPDSELLDALAHCYGVLSNLLDSAHEQAGVGSHPIAMHGTGRAVETLPSHRGRMPCMVTTLDARTAHYRYGDGQLVGGHYRSLKLPDAMPARTAKRYGLERFTEEMGGQKESIFDYMIPLMDQAKRVLQKDKCHIFIVFFFKGTVVRAIQSAVFEDRPTKHAYARHLANQVAVDGFDGIITLGEVWNSGVVLDEDGAVIAPEHVPDRREGLEVYAEVKGGEHRTRITYFHRRFGRIVYDEVVDMDDQSLENNFMHPVRQVWKSQHAADNET